jgi:hypothetical protein
MSIVRVQSANAHALAASSQTVLLNGVVGGNSLLVLVHDYYSSSPKTASDDKSNSYTTRIEAAAPSDPFSSVSVISADNVTGGNVTITVSAGSATYYNIIAIEYSGLEPTGSWDTYNVAFSSGFDSGTVTPATTNALLIGCGGRLDTTDDYTLDSPWSAVSYENGTTISGLKVADQIVSAGGSYKFSGTASSANHAVDLIGSFKAAGGSAPAPQPYDIAHTPQHQALMAM